MMIRLTVATLAALYGVLHVFGGEDRRPSDVARADSGPLEVVSVAALSTPVQESAFIQSDISDSEAITMALDAGKKLRESRKRPALSSIAVVAASEATASNAQLWYVTGSRVNLRRGPGTGNPVVGQVTWGAEAEVLSNENGWYEIRLADGSVSGWIFGKFLNDQRPG